MREDGQGWGAWALESPMQGDSAWQLSLEGGRSHLGGPASSSDDRQARV